MLRSILTALLLFGFAVFAEAQEAPGVFVRFQLLEPANASWHVRLGGQAEQVASDHLAHSRK